MEARDRRHHCSTTVWPAGPLLPVVLIDPCLHLVYDPVLGLLVALVYLLIRNNFYFNIPLTHKHLHMLLRNYTKGNRRPKIAGYLFKVNKDAGHSLGEI